MFTRMTASSFALAALAAACTAQTDEDVVSRDNAITARDACQIVLHEAKISSQGRSQCTLDATVDVAQSAVGVAEVHVLYKVAGDGWAELDGTEGAAVDGFRRFSFHHPFVCNPIELIPFFDRVGGGSVWDHNRTAGNYTSAVEPDGVCAKHRDVSDKSCLVRLNEATLTPLGRSQCRLDATVDVSNAGPTFEKVELLYRVGSDGWAKLSSTSEAWNGATRRFTFRAPTFGCNPVELISLATAQNATYWDHNRTDGNLTIGGDSEAHIGASDACP